MMKEGCGQSQVAPESYPAPPFLGPQDGVWALATASSQGSLVLSVGEPYILEPATQWNVIL